MEVGTKVNTTEVVEDNSDGLIPAGTAATVLADHTDDSGFVFVTLDDETDEQREAREGTNALYALFAGREPEYPSAWPLEAGEFEVVS